MKTPLISIVTIVYNSEHLIEKTINSVISQEFKDYEYIVIDGKSTDRTLSIINKYKEDIDLIISEPDQGIYDALNKSLNFVNCEFVLFLHSGDHLYDSTTLKKVFDAYNRNPNVDFIYGAAEYIYEKHTITFLPDFQKVVYGITPCHQASYVKTDLVKKIRFDTRYRSSADFDFWVQLYTQTPPVTYTKIKEPLVKYLPGGFSSDKSRGYRETAQIIKERLPLIYYYDFVIRKIFIEQKTKSLLQTLGLKRVGYFLAKHFGAISNHRI